MEEEKEPSIRELLQAIKDQNEKEPVKPKEWKIPFKGRVNKMKANKGWATIQIIRNNGEMQFEKAPIVDGIVRVDKFPRIGTIDYKLSYKGKPFLIIPEWSMKPFSPVENYAKVEQDKMNIAGRRTVLATLEGEKIKGKGLGGNYIGWIILIVAVGAAAYYLFKGGKLF